MGDTDGFLESSCDIRNAPLILTPSRVERRASERKALSKFQRKSKYGFKKRI